MNKGISLLKPLVLALVAGGLILLERYVRFGFYFEGSVGDFKTWFPSFWILAYVGSKLLFPVLYSFLLVGMFTDLGIKRSLGFYLVVAQAALLFILQKYWGLNGLLLYGVVLSSIWMGRLGIQLSFWSTLFAFENKKVGTILVGSCVGLTYLFLCLMLPPFHPFSRYTMFDRFQDSTTVYLLRDEHAGLIALEKYSKLKNDDLNVFYRSLCQKDDSLKVNDTIEAEKQRGIKLIQLFLKSTDGTVLPFDSIGLYKATISQNQQQIEIKERLIVNYALN